MIIFAIQFNFNANFSFDEGQSKIATWGNLFSQQMKSFLPADEISAGFQPTVTDGLEAVQCFTDRQGDKKVSNGER